MPCVCRYQRQLKDMKEQVKEAEAREQEVTKKKRTAVSNTSSSLHTIPQYHRDHCYVLEDSNGHV